MPLKTHVDEQPSLNLTPMIDIVFLLIIFFMLGTKFNELTEAEKNMPLKVPEVSELKALTPAPEKRVVNVYRDGRIYLDERAVTLDELIAELSNAREEYAELGVVVRSDAHGEVQNLATVLSAVRRAGIVDMGISVRVAQRER